MSDLPRPAAAAPPPEAAPGTRSAAAPLAALRGLAAVQIPAELAAALTLAAIALPEQVATARLMGLPPSTGLIAFAAGTLAFALFGRHRTLSVGADSTIAPIMAAGLGGLAVTGSAHYALLAAILALMTGGLLILSRALRLGWIADLLSVPVTAGFMVGIATHIIVSALPPALGLAPEAGSLPHRLWLLIGSAEEANPATLALALGVAGIALAAERWRPRWPGPLIALALGTTAAWALGRQGIAVPMLDTLRFHLPGLGGAALPNWQEIVVLLPLALIIALMAMMQTAAVLQSHEHDRIGPPDPDRAFAAVGAGSVLAGLLGSFAVNASPPRTAVAAAAGARSQWSALLAAAITLGVALAAAHWFAHIPRACVNGVLIFIGLRLIRPRLLAEIGRRAPAELALAAMTALLVIALPVMLGVGLAVILSLLHAIYRIARPDCAELGRVPGTTIWWAHPPGAAVEHEPGVLVVALGAPLNFINTRFILAQVDAALRKRHPRLLILEASGVVSIDFTGARMLSRRVAALRADGVSVALARLESEPARAAADRTGLVAEIGAANIFFSVEAAVRNWADSRGADGPGTGGG